MVNRVFIDGYDLEATYGISHLKSEGQLDLPPKKVGVSFDFEDEHGTDIDLSWNYYEDRVITMKLLLKADSNSQLQSGLSSFINAVRITRHIQLRYAYLAKVFMVYASQGVKVRVVNKFGSNKIFAELEVSLIENNPINRQFTTTVTGATQVSLTLTTSKTLTIFWGDGTSETVTGTVTKTHSGYAAGTKYIVLAGDVDSISGFSKSANLTEI